MKVHKDSVKQEIRDTAKKLQIFTRSELYRQTYDLENRAETARREFSYLMKMGVIKKTTEKKNNLIVYKYVKKPIPTIKQFF